MSWPISRVLSWATIPLGCLSPDTSSNLPDLSASHANEVLFGLAPSGVCRAGLLPESRCALTAPFHPYRCPCGHLGGFFLLHCPSARAAQALPGTLLCGARTFLCRTTNSAAVAWPTRRAGYSVALILSMRVCASSAPYNTFGTCPHTGFGQQGSPSKRTM